MNQKFAVGFLRGSSCSSFSFFNNLIDHVNIDVINYVDHTVLYFAAKDIDEIESIFNSEMEKIGNSCNIKGILP